MLCPAARHWWPSLLARASERVYTCGMSKDIRIPSVPALLGESLRAEFPIFENHAHQGIRLAYLDTAASAQKPACVLKRMKEFYEREYANVSRGAYALSARATELYEQSRVTVADFLGVSDPRCIVFTQGVTAAINLAALALESRLSAGDVILLTLLEHHSNIVPWQLLAARRGMRVEFVEITPHGTIDRDDLSRKIKQFRPKIFACTAFSNALGTLPPVAELIAEAQAAGALVLIDGAQSAPHGGVDLSVLRPDLFVCSGHKMYGPTGVGVLYGRYDLLASLPPVQGGGGMIERVTVNGSTFMEPPHRFEAGTPPIAEVIGLAEAVRFLGRFEPKAICAHERELTLYALEMLRREPGVQLYGPATAGEEQRSIVAFTVEGIHPHDLASVADAQHVQLRAGHHCAMPLLARLGVQSTARISFGLYSTRQDVDQLREALGAARRMFSSEQPPKGRGLGAR